MTIRTFTAGDDAAQVSIYNEAAAALPKFKTGQRLDEVRAPDAARPRLPTPAHRAASSPWKTAVPSVTPPSTPTAASAFRGAVRAANNGRSRCWRPCCRRCGAAAALRGAFAAYRADWPAQCDFFLAHGFTLAREMVNFVLELTDMPTPSARPTVAIEALTAADVAAVYALAPKLFRAPDAAALGRHLLENPYFPPSAVSVMRSRSDGAPVGLGVLVENPAYADPRQIDAAMPCFRLGAVGAENMQAKRVNGLFSFAAAEGRDFQAIGLDLLGHAALRLQDTETSTFAAQAPSDAPHLLRFYKQYFRRQGSFPIYERSLS